MIKIKSCDKCDHKNVCKNRDEYRKNRNSLADFYAGYPNDASTPDVYVVCHHFSHTVDSGLCGLILSTSGDLESHFESL